MQCAPGIPDNRRAEQRRQKIDRRPQVSSFPYEWANIIFPTVEKETEQNNVLSLRSVEMTDVSAGNLQTDFFYIAYFS